MGVCRSRKSPLPQARVQEAGQEQSPAAWGWPGGAQGQQFPPSLSLQNLLRAGSAVLALENREHWAMLPHSEHGSASLMEQLRDYSGTLASNMKLTYLNPVGVVTPNISE